jgi:hypothetical protein
MVKVSKKGFYQCYLQNFTVIVKNIEKYQLLQDVHLLQQILFKKKIKCVYKHLNNIVNQ